MKGKFGKSGEAVVIDKGRIYNFFFFKSQTPSQTLKELSGLGVGLQKANILVSLR